MTRPIPDGKPSMPSHPFPAARRLTDPPRDATLRAPGARVAVLASLLQLFGASLALPSLGLALALPFALPACASYPTLVKDGMPLPTENWISEEDEEESSESRKKWFEELHRSAPDVDWRLIERRNGEQQREKRNQLASMAAVSTRWSEVGSRNQAGRMHVVAMAPDGQSLYAGSALGGVWHGTLDGHDWTPLGDNIYGGAHFLAVVAGAQPGAPDVVLRATEDGLIHVTRDNGATWQQPTGVNAVNSVRRALVRADGSGTIFLVARYADTFGVQRWALYRSTDAALSFQRVFIIGTAAGDAWVSRTGPSPVWVLTGNKLRISNNDGDTFTDVSSLPVTTTAGELAGSEAGAPRFWAALDVGGTRTLYRSDNAGLNWSSVTQLTDYWTGSVNASIVNADLVAYGGLECFRSANAGASFTKVNTWSDYYGDVVNKLHADIPGIDVLPNGAGGEFWYVDTDGGLFLSTNGLVSVTNLSLNGLRVSQYYTTLTSAANPLHVVAGAQDQGYQRASAASSDPGGTLLDFAQIISGDYGHATSGDGTHAFVYSVYPGFVLVQKGEGLPQLYQVDFPSAETYSWLPFILADPLNNQRFFFCASHLYRYVKSGPSAWIPSQWSTQNFAAGSGEHLAALAYSPLDKLRMYGVTNNGRFFRSSDQGVTWAQGTGSGPGPQYLYGQAIVASNQDINTAYVGGSGYSNPAVWRTTDGGVTWQPWSDGLPATLVYCMAQAQDGSGALFAGTERGCFRRDPTSAAWVDITSNEAPITVYWSVESVPSSHVMRFGTYGRGIWDYSLDDPCTYEAHGTGLGGSNTVVLDSGSTTHIGSTHTLNISGAPPSLAGALLYSPSPASIPFKGGTLLVDVGLLLQIPVSTNGSGAASLPLAIPNDPLLVGFPLNFQAAFKQGPSGPWAFSNGLTATLCP